jgi:outer membrane immunogenic protein
VKKLSITGIAFAALIAPAVADEAPRVKGRHRHPVAVATTVDSWTGFYVGVALGAKWADTTWTTTSIFSGNFGNNTFFPVDASSPRNYGPSGFRWGGYVGYNWQVLPQWLLGVEADWAGANKTVTAAGIPGCTIRCIPGAPGPGIDTSSVKIRWDASVRARLGYLATPNLLAYVTGGMAWQSVETSATCQHIGPDPICFDIAGVPFSTHADTLTRRSWTVGGGADWRISANWIARAEYRYSQFGTRDGVLNLSVPNAATTVGYQLKVNTSIATLGLAYKFGYTPLVTK